MLYHLAVVERGDVVAVVAVAAAVAVVAEARPSRRHRCPGVSGRRLLLLPPLPLTRIQYGAKR